MWELSIDDNNVDDTVTVRIIAIKFKIKTIKS